MKQVKEENTENNNNQLEKLRAAVFRFIVICYWAHTCVYSDVHCNEYVGRSTIFFSLPFLVNIRPSRKKQTK